MRRIAMLSAAVMMAAVACSSDGTAPAAGATCPTGQKDCAGTCVSVTDPKTGCGEQACGACAGRTNGTAICVDQKCANGPCDQGFADCDGVPGNGCETELASDKANCGACDAPCSAANTASTCVSAACTVQSCTSPWENCDGNAANGCEADTKASDANCGGCGAACKADEHCYQGKCDKNAALLGWLDDHKAGWCLDDYTKLVNLCGKVSYCKWTLCGDLDQDPAGSPSCYADEGHEHERAVPFCCDPAYFKAYPQGLALDIGFYYDGVSTGFVANLGGDSAANLVSLIFNEAGVLTAGMSPSGPITTAVSAGRHLVSVYVESASTWLYLDGVLVEEVAGLGAPVELVAKNGPGFVIGARESYWWEDNKVALRFAPFFVHLRDGDEDPAAWSLDRATTPGTRTVVLFDETGVSGNVWSSTAGNKTGVAINKSATGIAPIWVADVTSQCL